MVHITSKTPMPSCATQLERAKKTIANLANGIERLECLHKEMLMKNDQLHHAVLREKEFSSLLVEIIQKNIDVIEIDDEGIAALLKGK